MKTCIQNSSATSSSQSLGVVKTIFLTLMAWIPLLGQTADPVVIAHRGASKVAPENTRSALLAAVERKAPVIEFDVRETVDGKLVLFHDSSLERIAGKEGSVEASHWSDLVDLDVGRWFGEGQFAGEKPILLAEALEICIEHDVVALVEHKSGSAKNYAAILQEAKAEQHAIVQSFQWDFLREFQKAMPGLPTGALGSKQLSTDKLQEIMDLQPRWVGWKYSDLNETEMKMLQEAGFQVALWTVNRPSDAKPWIVHGVNAIITDVPDVMLDLIEAGKEVP